MCNSTPTPNKIMQNHNDVDLNQLSIDGKNYQWKRPKCPKCHGKVWGHGYAYSIFTGHQNPLPIKKFRCPAKSCRTVVTMRPAGFWKKYQSSIKSIFNALADRLKTLSWPLGVPRQRGGHWLKKFIKKIQMDYGHSNEGLSLSERLSLLHLKSLHFFI